MGCEIERKFLVRSDAWREGAPGLPYRQAYLCREPGRTVRVRIAGENGFLTVKGRPDGLARAEFEYPIPVADAMELLELCDGGRIDKIRYRRPYEGLVWEIDEFVGANAGLVVAEIELPTVDHPFAQPEWVGEEVSGDLRYANSQLARHPFSCWLSDSQEE